MFLKFRDLKHKIGNLSIQILELLKSKSMYGYEIIQHLSDFKINTAILYPTLKKLEEMDLIKSFFSSQSRGPKRRKNYELTDKGFTFAQNLYDFKQVPQYYLEFFLPENEILKKISVGKDCLVIDSTNFISMETLLNSKLFYNNKIPKNIGIKRLYDFKNDDSTVLKDEILIGFPFFIQHEIKDAVIEDLVNTFKKVKKSLKEGGRLFCLDVEWESHAILDTFSFLINNKVEKMGFSFQEMQDILAQATFSNFQLLKKGSGIIIFSCT